MGHYCSVEMGRKQNNNEDTKGTGLCEGETKIEIY